MILHTVRDPVGAAFVGASLYPVANKKSHVTLEQVLTTLRTCFARHGLPEEIQTDGEGVLNSQPGDPFPSRFTLWLAGLGIRHVHARPGIPTDDAEVERSHRTLYDYALAGHLDQPLAHLRLSLEQACYELNHEYPSRAHGCYGSPPVQAHPELLHPPRPFEAQHELAHFNLERVDSFLAGQSLERKVGKTGQISIGVHHSRYCVGRTWAGQVVQVYFDPMDRCFVASYQGETVARWKANGLEIEDILGFSETTPGTIPQQLRLPFQTNEVPHLELSEV